MPSAPPSPRPGETTSNEPGGAGGALPWRKRHPVAARLLLYGVGLALAGLGLWLWLERRDLDRLDHVAALRARLEQLPLVLQVDPSGAEALRLLDADFADPGLPDDLEARAQRLRGVIARLRKDDAGMNRAFARARDLDPSPASVDALTLEWAYCRVDLGDTVGANLLLKAAVPADPVLAFWRQVVTARMFEASGTPEKGRRGLRTLLDLIPRPFEASPPVWFMLAEWRVEDVAIEAVRWLVEGLPAGSAAAAPIWKRLPELCPRYPNALLAATEGLLAAGDTAQARAIWKRLKDADAAFAAKLAERKPDLAALERP